MELNAINWNKIEDALPTMSKCLVTGTSYDGPYFFVALARHCGEGKFSDFSGNMIEYNVTHWVHAYHPDEATTRLPVRV